MQDEAASSEPSPAESDGQSEELLFHHSSAGKLFGTVAAAYATTFVLVLILVRMWDEDTIRLRVLDMLMRLFQTIARLSGGWALQCEQAYNDYANSLH